jgi:hypothetical protein
MRTSKSFQVLSKVLIVLGTFALTLGAFSGIVNNNLLNGPKLAGHIESIRQEPDVIAKMSVQLADLVIEKAPNAEPFRPVIENAAAKILSSDALSEPIRGAAIKLRDAFVKGQALKLEFTETANVAIEKVNMFAPQLGIEPIAELSLEPPAGSISATINTLQTVLKVSDTLAVALPIAAAVIFIAVILLAPYRRQGAQRVAKSVMISGGILAGISGAIWVATNIFGRDPDIGIYLIASWNQFDAAFWIPAAILIVAGGMAYTLLGGVLPDFDVPNKVAKTWKKIWARPANLWISFARAIIFIALGAFMVMNAQIALRGLLFIGSAFIIATAIFEFNRLLVRSIEKEKAS